MAEPAGFIGTGTMGGAMALRLLQSGQRLVVCDPSPEALRPLVALGAEVAASPKAVADRVKIVFSCLNTADIATKVALGEDGIVRGKAVKLHVEMSTIGSAPVEKIAAEMAKAGIEHLDAPVSGGKRGAAAGTLAVMVAGPREAFDTAEPLLKKIAGNVRYVGNQAGLAQTAKIVNNILSIAAIAVSTEAMIMGVKAGVDAAVLIDLINVSSGRNTATLDKFPTSILTGRFDFAASLVNQLKTMRLYIEETERLGTPSWVMPQVRKLYEDAAAALITGDRRDYDASGVVEYAEKLAGVEIRPGRAAPSAEQAPPQPEKRRAGV